MMKHWIAGWNFQAGCSIASFARNSGFLTFRSLHFLPFKPCGDCWTTLPTDQAATIKRRGLRFRLHPRALTIRLGEKAMQAQQRRYHRHQTGSEQFELLSMDGNASPPQRPVWDALPSQTRATLTELMTRLILDHAQNGRRALPREVCHDV